MKTSWFAVVLTLAFHNHAMASKTNDYHIAPLLAVQFEKGKILDWKNQLFSEKLDGIRGIWTGSQLLTKQGKPIFAPHWFVQDLPDYPIEGELWAGRGEFEHVLSVVMDNTPDEEQWKTITFMIFDLPSHLGDFSARYAAQINLVKRMHVSHIQYIPHHEAISEQNVTTHLNEVVNGGGEGLMLRDKNAVYQAGRNSGMMKLKIINDAEAQVIGYVAGNGKYQGQMGSLIVKMPNGITFKIGTGFNDEQRQNPPKIGTQITYRYNGFTKNGIPKFARYWRVDTSK